MAPRATSDLDSNAPTLSNLEWWNGAVIYESHLPSFRDGNGDGIGDLEGLTASLDYLAGTLGVDAVWVGPFFRSPLFDQGFDISDYLDVEPIFGTLEIFDRLVREAHARGIRVIVDYVPNHTSHLHPWFIESRSSRDNLKSDWYIWREASADGGPPNNWNSEAGGSVWEWDESRGQYYLHSHLVEQPDLNWRNPAVVSELHDVLRFWLDRGVDGFRIDVAHMLMKHPDFPDHPIITGAEINPFELQHPDFFTQQHIYDRRHPDTHDAMRGIRSVVDEYPGATTIAEIEAMEWDDWAEYYGEELRGIHLPFAFRIIETPWNASDFERELRAMYIALPSGAWPILALGNHDRSRLATRIGAAQARVAALLLLGLKATPCLLYADELGMTDQPVALERQRDYFARSQGGVSRDPVRTPMPWNRGRTGGFSTAEPESTWLPIASRASELSVESQLGDPESVLELYRTLLALRAENEALRHGDIEFLSDLAAHPDGPPVLAFRRYLDRSAVVVAMNFSSEPQPLPKGVIGSVLASTHGDEVGVEFNEGTVLKPDHAVILQTAPKGLDR